MYKKNKNFVEIAQKFMIESVKNKYSYNFSWLSRPIIQYPQDVINIQELIWNLKPDCIIETGIAHGGSVIFNASLLCLLELENAINEKKGFDPSNPLRKVYAVDIDIREHNLKEINNHFLKNRIELFEGSSIDKNIFNKINKLVRCFKKILVILDSNHSHDHVLSELNLYSDLVSKDSFCIVMDTIIDDLPKSLSPDRPWGPNNSPKSAVKEFLKLNKSFQIETKFEEKALITVAPSGFLKKIK